jgi:hypothetical protein
MAVEFSRIRFASSLSWKEIKRIKGRERVVV